MLRRLVGVAVSLAALIGSNLGTTAQNTYEICFADRINAERTSRDIPALKENEQMNIIASAHSAEMATHETIFHNDNLPNEPGVKPFAAIGENVGMGSSCPAVHQAFMDSPGHKANILDPDYTELGVGVTKRDDTIYVVEIFYDPAPDTPPPPPPAPPPTREPEPKCTCLG